MVFIQGSKTTKTGQCLVEAAWEFFLKVTRIVSCRKNRVRRAAPNFNTTCIDLSPSAHRTTNPDAIRIKAVPAAATVRHSPVVTTHVSMTRSQQHDIVFKRGSHKALNGMGSSKVHRNRDVRGSWTSSHPQRSVKKQLSHTKAVTPPSQKNNTGKPSN